MEEWAPPSGSIVRLGALTHMLVLTGGGPVLWSGGTVRPLPSWVRAAQDVKDLEDALSAMGRKLPAPGRYYHLAVNPDGKQLFILPSGGVVPRGLARTRGSAQKLLREFLGRDAREQFGAAIPQPTQPMFRMGRIAALSYRADKRGSTGQTGEFIHGFQKPLPVLYRSRAGWFVCGGDYETTWRGIER